MKLVFAGTPEAAVPSLRTLLGSSHEVAAVATRPDARAGRGRHLSPSPVAQVAEEAGIEVLKPEKASDPGFLDRLREIAPDCCPVVAYGALLRQEALDVPRHGWVNLHFSLLPHWRGAAPVQHAVLHGDDLTGASTFRIEPDLDSGPVFGTLVEPIGPADTSGDLLARLAESGAGLLLRTLDGIESGELEARAQSEEEVSFAPKITSADAEVEFTAPAMRVDRLIRACTPAPGPWTTFRGERLKLGPVRPVTDADAVPPGRLVVAKDRVFAGTATHPVELGEVQPQGKRRMPAVDWARGVRPGDSDVLGAT
ncbi:methionyl-tRNA formyltransferase [Streptomonospora litoralis]|uniref:Methionyl-tRNA formyltransferase n=1 Tax=Streptomonospora litoralis TaxID=2498135 RepID=A0A4P6Q0B4_9ACTN|nr:methionyl-tRNA formyltransferase [Streptomonospora litoralis]QBI53853.1 Methionyl-tRNA formyltransferase [Streptomonospora litoralis]